LAARFAAAQRAPFLRELSPEARRKARVIAVRKQVQSGSTQKGMEGKEGAIA
jgi:hypothetical protein